MNQPCGPLTWEYDGTSTNALASQKAVLKKGNVYTIAPMIADAQDHIYDSGIIFGPNHPTLKEIDFLPPSEIKKPDLFPDFSILEKREFETADWSSLMQLGGFEAKAGMAPRTGLIPDDSLTREPMDELLQHDSPFSTEMKRMMTV